MSKKKNGRKKKAKKTLRAKKEELAHHLNLYKRQLRRVAAAAGVLDTYEFIPEDIKKERKFLWKYL